MSSSNIVSILFVTDSSRNAGGFSLSYRFIDGSSCELILIKPRIKQFDVLNKIFIYLDCGGNFYSSFGYIQSPGWPENYEANKACVWVLNAPHGQQIELTINNFTLEYNADCRFDSLEIR